jgi:RecB family endonuclease NucS
MADTAHPSAPDERIVRSFRKNQREVVRVILREFEGTKLLDVRAFGKRDDGQEAPTRKGIAINVALLPELLAAIIEAETIARQMNWLAPEFPRRKAA